jgi:phosphoribosylformimino-5-aminoimidazole carboxamide ribonucleotide (ProFAR) isomerase
MFRVDTLSFKMVSYGFIKIKDLNGAFKGENTRYGFYKDIIKDTTLELRQRN